MAMSIEVEPGSPQTQVEAPPQEDLLSVLSANAKAVFEQKSETNVEALQNVVDAFTAKVVGTAFEVFRENFDDLLRLLRNSYGQVARFVDGDFRQDPGFYLGQLHALTEVAYRLGHQRVPREAVELVARSRTATEILTKVVEAKSIGAAELARDLNIEESNLSATCKALVGRELLRRDRFGKRVRYSSTPLTHAVVAHLGVTAAENNTDEEPELMKVAAAAASAESAPDWPKVAVELAAASLQPGRNVMANTDDFVSGLLTLAAIRGAKEVAIEPSTRRVRLEATAEGNESELCLPKSVSKSLTEQLKACARLSKNVPTNVGVVDWNGQKLSMSSQQTTRGTALKVRFIGDLDPSESRSKARVAFQEIQQEKERLTDFEKIYVREVLDGCRWKTSKAADILGIGRVKLASLMKSLNIEP